MLSLTARKCTFHNLIPTTPKYRHIPKCLYSVKVLPASRPFNILFFGSDEFSAKVLQELYQQHEIWSGISVATQPDAKIGRDRIVTISPVKRKALELGLETYHVPQKGLREWLPPKQFLDPSEPSSNLMITASFGRMIPDSILHLFPVSRRLNVHPSLIPLYRGPAPIQWAIADAKEETGVTILEMKEKKYGADIGEFWAQKHVTISPMSCFTNLRDSLAIEGGKLLISVLRDLLHGTAIAVPQDKELATYAPFITGETAAVDFHTWDAFKVERMYRAIGHQRALHATLSPSGDRVQLHSPIVHANLPDLAQLPRPLAALHSPGTATFNPLNKMISIRCANDTFIHVPTLVFRTRTYNSRQFWDGLKPEWKENRLIQFSSQA